MSKSIPRTIIPADVRAIVEHLFRQESAKLSSTLARSYGLRNLSDIEDIVQDALEAAMVSWSYRGVPEYATAWLFRVANNKATDLLRRRSFEKKHFVVLDAEHKAISYQLDVEKILLPGEIEDSMLRMMFACAHPGISVASQIALMLKTLCGFSVREIASAFLTKDYTIDKRLTRARKYFREHYVSLEPPMGRELTARRASVLTALYLVFNEGYKRTESGGSADAPEQGILDRDLCLEALRLALLVSEHESTRSPETDALIALMSFLAARFDTRTAENGSIVVLPEQDRSKWNRNLIERGMEYFRRSEPDIYSSNYHLEAGIQALHVMAPRYEETDWAAILGLYKRLYRLKPSPVVAMHEAVAIEKVHGADAAIEFLRASPLPEHYLYHAILGDVLEKSGRREDARESFRHAARLTRNAKEKALLEERAMA
ncbi:MAG TPA: sigma-70 family RNA polymerase sigma factor [Candidatus Kapabacteria bacterium]